MKVGTDKLDFIKTKIFCSMKDTVKRIKTKTIGWEKIFAKDISDEGLLPKTYKGFLRHKETNHSVKNGQKSLTSPKKTCRGQAWCVRHQGNSN